MATSRRRGEIFNDTLTADTGSISPLSDPDLQIHYRFTGKPLNPGSALQAFLDAQTFFSHYPGNVEHVNMVAYSM